MHIHWYPLTSSKNIWPKISVAYLAKWFQYIFSVGGWRMNPWNLPLLVLAYIPKQSCKNAFFEAWTWPEPEITSPNTARDRHLFLKPDLDLKAKLAREFWQRCRSRQIFWGYEGYLLEFSQTSPKIGRQFFQIKRCWAPFLLILSRSLWRFSEILPWFWRILSRISPN